jgi:geranylgeranyl diphosphate synthase, type II
MLDIAQSAERIEKYLREINLPQEPANLYEPLRYFLALGGKRLRPVSTILSGSLFNATEEDLLPVATAIELFHNFTLLHDDIMDEAPLRRGKETVHQKWNTNIAILSGDVLFVRAYQELLKCNPKILPELLQLFNKTAIEVCEGQQMDMDFETRDIVSIEEYIEMIRLKTSVLLGCAMAMGGIVGGANEEQKQFLYDIGMNLGIGFQIQDDILDLYGDAEKVGKQVGGDVMANKKTFLSISARNQASEQQLSKLDELQEYYNAVAKVEITKQIFNDLGIEQQAVEKMHHFFNKAEEGISKLAETCDISKLTSFVGLIQNRTF